MLITVVRHAESMGNAGLGGGENPHLSPRGWEQAAHAAERLSRERVTHVWSSPFRRAIETARMIAEGAGVAVVLQHEMCEHYIYDGFRTWRCPTGEAIVREFPGVRLAADFPKGKWTPAWGESWEAICARTARVAKRALALGRRRARAGRQTHLVIVGHGASVKAVLRSLSGLDIAQPEPYVNAGLSRVRATDTLPGKVVFLNDAGHLAGM